MRPMIYNPPPIASVEKFKKAVKINNVVTKDEPISHKVAHGVKAAIGMSKKYNPVATGMSAGEFIIECVKGGHKHKHCATGAAVATATGGAISTTSGRVIVGSLAAETLTGGMSTPASMVGVAVGCAGLCVADEAGKVTGHATVSMLEAMDDDDPCSIM